MSRPLPIEMRERVVAAVEDEGMTIDGASKRFMVGTATVKRWLKLSREKGTLEPRPMGGLRYVWIGEDDRAQLELIVSERNDATSEELTAAYNARFSTEMTRSSMQRALERFGFTLKKRVS